MSVRSLLPALLLGAAATACTDLDVTNPNAPSAETFWSTEAEANQGLNAAYNGLMHNGTYGRWLGFALDIRSDIGHSPSPWTDLSNYNKFTVAGYDFEVNRELWIHHYQAIFRANQVIAEVPGITMDATRRGQIVGQAKFLRALLYFNLENLFGGNIPMPLAPSNPTDRPGSAGDAAVWAQIQTDLTDAIAVLPTSWTGANVGRATKGAAQGLLGKVLLQQRKWSEASTQLAAVISSGTYSLRPNYAENFTSMHENNSESLFEVQFGDRTQLAAGVRGLNIAKMIGPCGPGYCDGRPTRWYFDEFLKDSTTTGQVDPRLDATIFYNKPGGMDVYGTPFATRYGAGSTEIFFKKYGEYYIAGNQDWDASINYRVLRYSDVLLMQAEALNEQNQPAAAAALVNQVRARVSMKPISTALSQSAMRDAILHERLVEFGLEGQRWLDLKRHNLLTAANRPVLISHDAEFNFFTVGKSEVLPIPTSEINLNPNVKQNPGY